MVTGSSTCRTVIKPVEPRLAGFSIRKLKHAAEFPMNAGRVEPKFRLTGSEAIAS